MLSYPKLSQYRGQKYLQVHFTVSISYLAFLDYYIAISINPKLTVAEFYFPGDASGKEPACQGKRSLGQENPLEEGMAIHSSILAWKVSWTEKPGRLWSIGSQRVGHDWSNLTGAADFYLKNGNKWVFAHEYCQWEQEKPKDSNDLFEVNRLQQQRRELEEPYTRERNGPPQSLLP